MAEIPQLDFQLMDEGWEKFEGKSFNVWGLVDFPPELLKYIIEYKNKPHVTFDKTTGKKIKKTGVRAPVWTAFDKYLYNDYNDKSKEKLPKISATFKSCFDHKYGAIVENLGMKIAIALDMPTSYNYLVAFDAKKFPKIVQNYPTPDYKNKIQPIGIVSIDFLQARQTNETHSGKTSIEQAGIEKEIDSFSYFEGDKLVTFKDALKKYHIALDQLAGEENYIEHWINVVDKIAKEEFKNIPKEKLNKITDDIHSRIARSFLLKDCLLGDCDFTSYNGGIVVNSHKIRYAATHDYGDICNGLVKNKLTLDLPNGMTEKIFNSLPKYAQEVILNSKQKFANKSIEELAEDWASSSSEHNFYYVLKNFPSACEEFFEKLDNLVRRNQINKIVDQYTKLTLDGAPLLSNEEAKSFKKYLTARAYHYCNLYVDYKQKNHESIPYDIEFDDYAMN